MQQHWRILNNPSHSYAMKTISDIYKYLCQQIPELEARMILKERAGIEWADIIANPDQEIETQLILNDLQQIRSGKPLSKIYGKREFWGLEFEVNEHVLDPRPDSETLIEAALAHYKGKQPPKTILDLGTGSGCLLLSLLSEFPQAQGIGIDISADALKVAKTNAKNLHLESRVTFIDGQWAESLEEKFDLIISNPPYIQSKVIPNLEKNVKNYDPILALDGGIDGLDAYKSIFSDLPRVLNDDGIAFFEIGFDQADDIVRLSKKYKIRNEALYYDLAGNPRVVEIFKK